MRSKGIYFNIILVILGYSNKLLEVERLTENKYFSGGEVPYCLFNAEHIYSNSKNRLNRRYIFKYICIYLHMHLREGLWEGFERRLLEEREGK